MATMNKSVPFKDGDNLDLYLSTASEYTAVTLKTLCAEKEYMDYVLKRGY